MIAGMTVHAFVDESRQGDRYYLAAALVRPRSLAPTRRVLRGLLLPNEREIHFSKEKPPRRRSLADAIARLPVEVHIYHHGCGRQDERARQACLAQLAEDLMEIRAHRLVLDSRDVRDAHDNRTLYLALDKNRQEPQMSYEHMTSSDDPLLWIADVAAWCYRAKGDWPAKVKPIIAGVHNVDFI